MRTRVHVGAVGGGGGGGGREGGREGGIESTHKHTTSGKSNMGVLSKPNRNITNKIGCRRLCWRPLN